VCVGVVCVWVGVCMCVWGVCVRMGCVCEGGVWCVCV